MKTHIFHVSGTHCASCKILIEDVLSEENFVKNVRVDLKREIIEILKPIQKEKVILTKLEKEAQEQAVPQRGAVVEKKEKGKEALGKGNYLIKALERMP